jgi:hypothetical protein
MARGMEQILVPAQIRGVTMRRIVVGTELRNRKLRAYAVEVAEPAESLRWHAYEAVRQREFRGPFEVPVLQTARFAAEADEIDAAAQTSYLDQVRLHAFAGLPVTDDSLRNSGESIRGALADRDTVEADGTRFRCATIRVAVDYRLLAVRTGVAEEFLSSTDAYRSEDSAGRRNAYQLRRSVRCPRLSGRIATGVAMAPYPVSHPAMCSTRSRSIANRVIAKRPRSRAPVAQTAQ